MIRTKATIVVKQNLHELLTMRSIISSSSQLIKRLTNQLTHAVISLLGHTNMYRYRFRNKKQLHNSS